MAIVPKQDILKNTVYISISETFLNRLIIRVHSHSSSQAYDIRRATNDNCAVSNAVRKPRNPGLVA